MWKSTAGGRALHFHLAGINNQNFIMRDEETGSWWQQISGCAILGPLKGTCLQPVAWDEVSFAVFKAEHPAATILLPVEEKKADYASADWEKEIAEMPTVTPVDPKDPLQPRDLVVGVKAGGTAKAYPWAVLAKTSPIVDTLGGTPLLILIHPDGRSLRCFDRRVDGKPLEMFRKTDACPPAILDAATGSEWDFSGVAVSGPMAGRRLERVSCLKDYWFDWKVYNPETRIFSAGLPDRAAAPPAAAGL